MNHANISIVFFQLSAIVATLAITFAVIAVAAVLRSGHPASALRPFVGRAIIPVYLVGTSLSLLAYTPNGLLLR